MGRSALEDGEEVIAFEPHCGPVWLRLRGSPRAKAFVAETFTSRVEQSSVSKDDQR